MIDIINEEKMDIYDIINKQEYINKNDLNLDYIISSIICNIRSIFDNSTFSIFIALENYIRLYNEKDLNQYEEFMDQYTILEKISILYNILKIEYRKSNKLLDLLKYKDMCKEIYHNSILSKLYNFSDLDLDNMIRTNNTEQLYNILYKYAYNNEIKKILEDYKL